MATNFTLDDDLVSKAKRIGRHRTKKEAVLTALREYIARREQLKVTDLFGCIEFDESYDYKKARLR